MNTTTAHAHISIDVAPSVETLRLLWQQFERDPLRPMLLADTTAFLSAQHFCAAVGNTILPFVPHVDGAPAGMAWLYDVAMVTPKMIPVSAFLAVYVLEAFRSKNIIHECASEFLDIVRGYGLEQLWAEVRTDNVAPQYALRTFGFEQVAVLPSWKRYGGVWQNMVLYRRTLGISRERPWRESAACPTFGR